MKIETGSNSLVSHEVREILDRLARLNSQLLAR